MQCHENPFIVPFFIPHAGCPHQCSFCNQRTISGRKTSSSHKDPDIEAAVNIYLGYSRKKSDHVQLAFFGGNFLGLGEKNLAGFLEDSLRLYNQGIIHSIRFSTRPDTVNPYMISLLKDYPVSTIEIGTQSMDQRVLDLSLRGHTPDDTAKAVGLCRDSGFETGIQVMIGLPGEDYASCINTGNLVAALAPDFVRIYPTLVVEGSPLAESYRNGEYLPLELNDAVIRARELYLVFTDRNIRVIRMGLQATDDLVPGTTVLAGPYHPAFGHLVLSAIFLDRIRKQINLDFSMGNLEGRHLLIRCSSRSVSRVRGNKNENTFMLKTEYNLAGILVESAPDFGDDEFCLSLK